jgi:hypothetical protein
VEILKFAEPPKRSSRTNTKKRGGIMPLLAVVVSVAVVGGMSTTLAGTINLGTNNTVEFGQGVVTTAACDTSISITPSSAFDTSTSTFSVATIALGNIGTKVKSGSETSTVGAGCLGKVMTIRAYDSEGTALDVTASAGTKSVAITIPSVAANADTYGNYTGGSVSSASGFAQLPDTEATATQAGAFTISGLKISGSVTKITLESSSPV